MKDKGYEPVMIGDKKATDVLTNGSGHGLDHLMTDGDGNLIVGETKANRAKLNKNQKKGVIKYLEKQLEDMRSGLDGNGRYKNFKDHPDADAIEEKLDMMEEALDNKKVKGEVYRVPLEPDDDKDKQVYTPKEDEDRCRVATGKEIKEDKWKPKKLKKK